MKSKLLLSLLAALLAVHQVRADVIVGPTRTDGVLLAISGAVIAVIVIISWIIIRKNAAK